MPALGLGRGGLQSDPMIEPHIREQRFEVAVWEVRNEPDIGGSGGTPHYSRHSEGYNQIYDRTVTG